MTKTAAKNVTGRSRAAKLNLIEEQREQVKQQLADAAKTLSDFYTTLAQLGGESCEDLDAAFNELHDATSKIEALTQLHINEQTAKGRPAVSAETARLVALNID